jgi:flagellar basal-body rod modification protein FlgD
MDIGSVSQVGSPSTTSPVGSNKLGKDEFVKLLLAQMAHQDPMSPQSSDAFVAQLAQFASVEQQQATNSNLESLLVAQAANNQTGIAQLVGKDVVYQTDHVSLDGGKATPLEVKVAAPAQSVTVTVKDEHGNVVATQELGPQEGTTTFTWDGRTSDGAPAPDGTYTVSVSATGAGGQSVDATLQGRGHVDAVSFEGGVPVLLLGSLKVGLADVVQIAEAGGDTATAPATSAPAQAPVQPTEQKGSQVP